MKTCLTMKFLSGASGCLIEKPQCGYAQQWGFSFICNHPDHAEYNAHVDGCLTRDEALQRYNSLKQKRRNEFIAGLDEESRSFFCHKTAFHGQTLPSQNVQTSEQ